MDFVVAVDAETVGVSTGGMGTEFATVVGAAGGG